MVKRIILFAFLLNSCVCVLAQNIFDEEKIKEVKMLIMNRKHDKADSILDLYVQHSQDLEHDFAINLAKCYNGYMKIGTYGDPSVITPYSDYGKKAFKYVKSILNEKNAQSLQCWPLFSMWAEIYNYLNDSIIIDISALSSHYYKQYDERDLFLLYNVQKNTFQYYESNNKYDLAAEIMESFFHVATEANDTSLLMPISAAAVGEAYLNNKEYKKAEEWLIKSYDIFKVCEKTRNQVFCEMLEDLIYTYCLDDSYTKALPYSKEFCDVCGSLYGEYTSEYVNALALMIDVEIGIGKVADAYTHLETVVKMLNDVPDIDESKKDFLMFSYKLISLYLDKDNDSYAYNDEHVIESIVLEAYKKTYVGEIESAESLYKHIIPSLMKKGGIKDIGLYGIAVEELSSIFVRQGKFAEADSLLNHSLLFLQNNPNSSIWVVNGLYAAKGTLYKIIHNVDESLYWYNMAKESYSEESKKTIGYARMLSCIANCLCDKGDYIKAKELTEEAFNIFVNSLGEHYKKNNERLIQLCGLGRTYVGLNDYQKAKEIFEFVISEAKSNNNESIEALSLLNLSIIYLYENNYSKAENLLKQTINLKANIFDRRMIDFYSILINCLNADENAIVINNRLSDDVKSSICSSFGKFSEMERENYWSNYSLHLSYSNNIVATTFLNPQTIKMAYDNVLFTKNMLLNSEKLYRSTIKNSNNRIANNNYAKIQLLKERLTRKGIDKNSAVLIKDSISHLEKQILSSISDFSTKLLEQFKTMDDVMDMLSETEVALEFTLLPHLCFPIDQTSYYLGVFILSKDKDIPIVVELCSEKELENLVNSDNTLQQEGIDSLYNIKDSRLYQMIWAKIKPYVPEGSTIYFSPSGTLNRINLSAISDGTKRLSAIYNLYEVSTTANIDNVKSRTYNNNSAALYGDINYYEDIDQMSYNSTTYKSYSSGDILVTRSLTRGTWDLLPGTKDEIYTISTLMGEKGMQISVFDNNNANEESFKSLDGQAPDIIHISTHGFYFPSHNKNAFTFFNGYDSYTQKDLSMFHCGLIFAGANNAWVGKPIPYDVEDGILTAEEISRIDLSNNKLVVLSACDTGLGDVDMIDGVWGIQRGFKKAGAGTILMSLWKFPDEETKQLMTVFYKQLLSGHSVHDSLLFAQQKLKEMGKTPYYWAGFILLD